MESDTMNFVNGITLLLSYQLVGEISVRALGLPVPGPVLGMLLLFLTLLMRRSSSASLESASSSLLSHLSLLFVPAGVGIMVHFDRITEEWLPISMTLLLSTVLTMAATAGIMLGFDRLRAGRAQNDE